MNKFIKIMGFVGVFCLGIFIGHLWLGNAQAFPISDTYIWQNKAQLSSAPAMMLLLGIGLVGITGLKRRK